MFTESHTQTVLPTEATLTIEEARAQIKFEDGVDDDLVQTICLGVDEMAENKTGRALMQSTHEYVANLWPCTGIIKLWPGNLVSVTSVQYYNAENVLTALVEGTDYEVNTRSKPGRIIMIEMPTLYDRHDAILITYKVGYGASGANEEAQRAAIPAQIKLWLKLNFATLYENRSIFSDGVANLQSIQTYADHLIYPFIL